ncbi:hypothetical protein T552_02683 [Pneumocystis carinii B80]|uniref:Ubiquitin carboxyl-terminal hydrolase n=1 Tax=Pneumocystis carinii (strain B80) TaxID=1408658 RepID=A0A0W4ZE81_PNEC8|nr:hypothetical protein T552_02683 [Pneumocystis carinii B80]KTW26674.1 hypothetical protein T552_02683 [Pneumocystis carinii B80]
MFFNFPSLLDFYSMFFDILEEKKKSIEKIFGKNIFDKIKLQNLVKNETNIKHEQIIGGLYNSGNSCYINCIIQSFASLNELEYILEKLSKEQDNPIASATFSIIFKLNHSSSLSRTHSTSKLIKTLSLNKKIYDYEQQDAQEFFQILTTQLNTEILRMSKKCTEKGFSDSIKTRSEICNIENEIKSPFDGLMANRLECINCGFSEGIIHSSFTSVSLPLSSSQELCSLEDCLSAYVNKEMIEDILCQKCSLIASKKDLEILLKSLPNSEMSQNIKKKLNAIISALETEVLDAEYLKDFKLPRLVNSIKSKQIMFARLPKILTLHINRSTISPINGSIYKNTASITFPLILDLNRYTTSYSTLWIDPIQTTSIPNQKNQSKYELKSIIVHYGSHTFGHYVTFRKTLRGWFKISDRNVRACSIEEVLHSGNVFMLMYEQIKDNLNINQIIQNFRSENYTKPYSIKYLSSVFNNGKENCSEGFQTETKTQNSLGVSTINNTNYLYPIMKTCITKSSLYSPLPIISRKN